MRIYLTHCSKRKDDSLKHTGRKVTPCQLYTARPTVRFMNKCKEMRVRWAILSDHHGVWFPEVHHEWYGDDVGDPRKLTDERFARLVADFDEKLCGYDEIVFYHNPGRFHSAYKRLLGRTALRDRIRLISYRHLDQVK